MVTEFAPCGSLADCIKKHSEPPDAIKRHIVIFDSPNVIIDHFGCLLSPAAERLKFLQKF